VRKYLITVFVLASIAFANQLLTNGSFEDTLTNGWQQSMGGGDSASITRGPDYDPDPDYEVLVYSTAGTSNSYAKLYQTVYVPTTDLEFSVNAKLYAYDNDDSVSWAGAAVVISYLDTCDSLLGDTKICAQSSSLQHPWINTSTSHIIEAPDSFWHDYSFNIDDELTNLPGVNPSDINKIQVALLDSTLWG
jgi:hypothetical protein